VQPLHKAVTEFGAAGWSERHLVGEFRAVCFALEPDRPFANNCRAV